MSHAFEAEGLVKRYGRTTALAGIDLHARRGTVLGVLGPNGAGKTTAIRILATLLRPDAGRVVVGGLDVVRDAARVRRMIGLTGQYATVDEDLTGAENLVLLGRLLDLTRADARARARTLLTQLGLSAAGDLRVSTYSGGMRRRLDLAAGLIGRPEVVFLDEPTTGLDPGKREELWATVRSLADEGSTVLLTTQYLEEADALADEITVIDHGRVIAHDTPAGLKQLAGGRTIVVRPADPGQLGAAARVVERVTGRAVEHRHGGALTTPVGADGHFTEVVGALRHAGVDVAELALRLPSLDEVFFSLTGVAGTGVTRTASTETATTETGTTTTKETA